MNDWQRENYQSNFYCGLGRDRTGDLTIFSRSLVPTELPSQTRFQCHSPKKAYDTKTFATRTGLEPATSAVTGRRANQLRYRALSETNKHKWLLCHLKAVTTFRACPQRDSNPCYRRERAMS